MNKSFSYVFGGNLLRKAVICGVMSALNIFATSAFAQQVTFPMLCHGSTDGSAMHFVISEASGGFATPGGALGDSVLIFFTKGQAAANSVTPPPGTCTWFDRGLYPNEPALLVQRFPGKQLNGGAFLGVPGLAYSVGGNDAKLFPYVPNIITTEMINNPQANPRSGTLFDPNTFYTFNVYNDGFGEFIITSIKCKGSCP